MAGAQDIALATAVARAGGLGALPCAMISPEKIRSEVARFRNQVPGEPINLNFFCHKSEELTAAAEQRWQKALAPYYREYGIDPIMKSSAPSRQPFNREFADLVVELKPEIVSFHFGLPEKTLLDMVKWAGVKVLSSATTVDEAVWLEDQGVDAIIAQGLEAGGHRGHFLSGNLDKQMGLFALLPQIVDAVQVPVIAAGGISDDRGVASALVLGATAVQIGTAFLLTPESKISSAHRQAIQGPHHRETALTNLMSGGAARGFMNRLMQDLGPLSDLPPPFPHASTALAPLRAAAEAQGRGDFSPLWAGSAAHFVREGSVNEIIERLGFCGN